MTKHFFIVFVLIITATSGFAQDEITVQSKYNPYALFAPNFYPSGGTISRAATGEPNVGYWQNKADYQINVLLNDVSNEIKGDRKSVV